MFAWMKRRTPAQVRAQTLADYNMMLVEAEGGLQDAKDKLANIKAHIARLDPQVHHKPPREVADSVIDAAPSVPRIGRKV